MAEESITLYFHPSCKASQKLLETIPQECQFIRKVNLQQSGVPQGITVVPAAVIQGKLFAGKELFDKINFAINGPPSVDIYKTNTMTGFVEGEGLCSRTPFFSPIDAKDGTEGIPSFDSFKQKTLEELKAERN